MSKQFWPPVALFDADPREVRDMNRVMVLSVATLTWLFVLSTILSGILWLGLRLARAKNKAEARARRILEI
jgi:hypothetical protein